MQASVDAASSRSRTTRYGIKAMDAVLSRNGDAHHALEKGSSSMGLFNRSELAEEVTSRQYLISAPPGPRTNNLGSACALQVSDLPVAAAERFGELLTVERLEPASALVRRVM